jgi:protein ImuB
LTSVLAQLARRAEALRRLDCVLYYEQAAPRVIWIGLARASRQQRHVMELLSQRLERTDIAPGVSGILLAARETSRWHGGQGELFEAREPAAEEALGALVDRLVGRLGSEAVVQVELVDDHQPERAYRFISAAIKTPLPSEIGDSHLFREIGEIRDSPLFRPVRLRARPVPIRVIALVPDGPPTWLWYRGRAYIVAHAAGPERLETAWWRGPDVRRDYFHITTESGEQFWIYHAPAEGRWYLHGLFA